ncbi:MbcA/ParS/Xre antitoxin family protein [Dyadobacter chenwenxiniae]|uniref:MbcA/ParS/Xre antitoxin family protein n=1 Tax=Dyadobacter chenwenxiniae TaxID=2906456 RepID=A0A9X1PMC1_9BACT|nr:antitoxin Xre-like helix-turn-helix domain-containing protein [Dyadobacter chenwenxiniae]MCF0063765.1 MbcA/ParS/Xre antitoxin family protein [Dyadobacter chenwenxiniae]UON83441.1 MbcA/ParS/Xre antitoxin family protein [Dyadobacter chenwenxiniae]
MDLFLDTSFSCESFAVIERVRAGILRGKADEVAGKIGLTDKEMAPILNMSERTLHRLRPDALLDTNSSERLLLLEQLLAHGLDVFDGRLDVLGRWLRTPLSELHQQTPLTILDTTTGFGMVHNVLGRIEHGIYA